MKEGWLGDDYVILFSAEEAASATKRYRIGESLLAYTIVGLRGWDDFIVADAKGGTYTVPTVPLDIQYLQDFSLPADPALQGDPRYEGKIKWYVKPIVFGGDPGVGKNLTWVSHEQHRELVAWWNATYRKHTT